MDTWNIPSWGDRGCIGMVVALWKFFQNRKLAYEHSRKAMEDEWNRQKMEESKEPRIDLTGPDTPGKKDQKTEALAKGKQSLPTTASISKSDTKKDAPNSEKTGDDDSESVQEPKSK